MILLIIKKPKGIPITSKKIGVRSVNKAPAYANKSETVLVDSSIIDVGIVYIYRFLKPTIFDLLF